MTLKEIAFDQVGYWSEVKLDIIKEYAAAYSRILSAQKNPALEHIYIDAFAGAGIHVSRTSGQFIAGSPMNALLVNPPFRQYHFIDLDENKIEELENLANKRSDVFIYHGDCNLILLNNVLHQVKWEEFRRALCILDPYGLHLNWRIVALAGSMRSVEIFLNFPVADINRNVLWRDRKGVSSEQIRRMNTYWGDESWKEVTYIPSPQGELFGPPEEQKVSNEIIAEAFRKRLNEVAGFRYVPSPIAMRNSRNAIVYFLYFASQKPVAEEIVQHIFNKYKERKVG